MEHNTTDENTVNTANTNNQHQGLPELITVAAKKTAPWMTFLAIMGFIGAGLMVIASLIGLMLDNMPQPSTYMSGGGHTSGVEYYHSTALGLRVVMFIIYLAVALVVLRYSMLLLNAARKFRQFAKDGNVDDLGAAMWFQKSYWQLVGWFTIICLGLVVLAFLVAMLVFIIAL
ncbi:MAG: hypothetical protein LBI96_05695 [Odoribacteraceae bacterium]|jgi:hypothetical protein|nr:hypothetical protein [Odoribacteraceae bacterium]